MIFKYSRRIHFYETDAMEIVHHGVYVLLMEEARVDLLRQKGIFSQMPLSSVNYPVLALHVDYNKPLYFDDEVTVELSLKIDRVRFSFEYVLRSNRFTEPVALGRTEHVAMDMATRKPIKVPVLLARLSN